MHSETDTLKDAEYSRSIVLFMSSKAGDERVKTAAEMNNSTVLSETTSRCTAFGNLCPPSEPLGFKIPKIAVYVVILLVCTVGNTAIIAVIFTSRRMRSLAGNILILNLAFVDLLTPVMSIPFDLVLEENHYIWPFGSIPCKLIFPTATFLSTASSLTLAAISLDRYRNILHPFKSKLSMAQVKSIVITADFISVLFVFPYAAFLGLQNNFCMEEWPKFLYRQIYTVFLAFVQYALPLLFMIAMYILASVRLFAAADSVRKISLPVVENGRKTYSAFKEHQNRKESFVISQEQNAKVTKIFVIIVTAFALCTLPNQVLWLWIDFGKDGDVTSLAKEIIICRFFTYINGCVNPIIFFVFKRDYRQGLFKLLRKIARRRQETDLEKMRRIWDSVDIGGVKAPKCARRIRYQNDITSLLDLSSKATHSLTLHFEDSNKTYPPRKCTRKINKAISDYNERTFFLREHLSTERPLQRRSAICENVKDTNENIPVKRSVLPARSNETESQGNVSKLLPQEFSETEC